MRPWVSPGTGQRKPWRYLPELLRNLERAPEPGDPCGACDGPTDILRGPRASLTWCPSCLILSVDVGDRRRAPVLLGPLAGRSHPIAPPGMGPTTGIR